MINLSCLAIPNSLKTCGVFPVPLMLHSLASTARERLTFSRSVFRNIEMFAYIKSFETSLQTKNIFSHFLSNGRGRNIGVLMVMSWMRITRETFQWVLKIFQMILMLHLQSLPRGIMGRKRFISLKVGELKTILWHNIHQIQDNPVFSITSFVSSCFIICATGDQYYQYEFKHQPSHEECAQMTKSSPSVAFTRYTNLYCVDSLFSMLFQGRKSVCMS